jgi:hypothetical protein
VPAIHGLFVSFPSVPRDVPAYSAPFAGVAVGTPSAPM